MDKFPPNTGKVALCNLQFLQCLELQVVSGEIELSLNSICCTEILDLL